VTAVPMTYTFMAGDPVCVEAVAGRLESLYTILNGYAMFDILPMLETLATGYRSISLDSYAQLQLHFSAIEQPRSRSTA